jgi:23S rRNA (uracil1939-C5)-methyltransferase
LLRHLVVRIAAATGEIMVNLVATQDDFAGLGDLATALPQAIPHVKSLLASVNTRIGDTAIPERTQVLAGSQTIAERIGPFEVEVSARSFLQTNTQGTKVLYEMVHERAALTGSERVLDLYSGIGLIGLWLAAEAREVVGVEQAPEAVADAERLRDRVGYDHVRFVVADAGVLLPEWVREGRSFDVAIVDPPRAGLHPKALAALTMLAPPRIVYVSCNASSLARDMKELVATGYAAGPVAPLDMFPQTAHVESVVRLDRARGNT